ncbi:MAG: phosphatase PAP2 family protein [Bacteroidales bacterium]
MIQDLDKELFLFLNSLNSPFWDEVMWLVTSKMTWAPLYIFMLYMFIRDHRRKALIIFLFAVAAVTISDQLSVHAFKEVFQRLRPSREEEFADIIHLLRGRKSGMYGFVSSHAANSFTIAVFSLKLINRRWYTISIILWAVAVSYSRVYAGVHYPGDIIGGAALGVIIGYAVWKAYDYTDRKLLTVKPWFNQRDQSSGGPQKPATSNQQ